MFKPGTKVKLTPFYRDNYPLWTISEGTVVEVVSQKEFKSSDLSKEERGIYTAKFGKQEIFTVTSLLVDFAGQVCLVADLGVEPI